MQRYEAPQTNSNAEQGSTTPTTKGKANGGGSRAQVPPLQTVSLQSEESGPRASSGSSSASNKEKKDKKERKPHRHSRSEQHEQQQQQQPSVERRQSKSPGPLQTHGRDLDAGKDVLELLPVAIGRLVSEVRELRRMLADAERERSALRQEVRELQLRLNGSAAASTSMSLSSSSAIAAAAAASSASASSPHGGSAGKHVSETSPGRVEVSESAQAVNRAPIWSLYEQLRQLEGPTPSAGGGMVVLYEARQRSTGQLVRVKEVELLGSPADLRGGQASVWREIAILKALRHPNIVRLLDYFQEDVPEEPGGAVGGSGRARAFLVLEALEGGEPLFQRVLRLGAYQEADAVRVLRQVTEALSYLHARGIAHRDLKPEVIMCVGHGDEEVVKLTGFALSRSLAGGAQLLSLVGSPGYVAPEVVEGEAPYDHRVDLWALGVITYILIAGYPPFYAKTPARLLEKIQEGRYRFGSAWKDLPEARDFVSRLLEVTCLALLYWCICVYGVCVCASIPRHRSMDVSPRLIACTEGSGSEAHCGSGPHASVAPTAP